MKITILLIGGLAILPLWLLVLRRWHYGLFLLLLYIPVSGFPTLLTNYSPIALLFKDLAFVAPMYIGFFWFIKERGPFTGFSRSVLLLIGLQVFIIVIQMLNPSLPNLMVSLIGAKVWLYYMPLMVISYSVIQNQKSFLKLLRPVVMISWLPAGLGIIQWIMSSAWSYHDTMYMFYGAAAESATQGFTSFQFGVSLYRLPSTFSFSAQYAAYLWAALVTSYMLLSVEKNPKWRHFARASFGLMILASFLSGARGAYFFIPLMLSIIFVCQHGIKGLLKPVLILGALLIPLSKLSGLDMVSIFSQVGTLLQYYSKALAIHEFLRATEITQFGLGTGMNTIAARYAFDDPTQRIEALGKIENYWGKTIVELGIPGFIIFFLWQTFVVTIAFACVKRLKSKELKGVAAALAAFFVAMFISNFKSFRMDWEPLNMYYWIFAGILFRLNVFLLPHRDSERSHPKDLKWQRSQAIEPPP